MELLGKINGTSRNKLVPHSVLLDQYCQVKTVEIVNSIKLSLYLLFIVFGTGPGTGGAWCDDAARHVDDAGLDQQLAPAGRLHEGHRRLVGRVRLLRLQLSPRIRTSQLRIQVSSGKMSLDRFHDVELTKKPSLMMTIEAISPRRLL